MIQSVLVKKNLTFLAGCTIAYLLSIYSVVVIQYGTATLNRKDDIALNIDMIVALDSNDNDNHDDDDNKDDGGATTTIDRDIFYDGGDDHDNINDHDDAEVATVPKGYPQKVGGNDMSTTLALAGDSEKERLQRITNVYKHKYNYHPPATSNDTLTIDASCGSSPDFESFFSQDYLLRSRYDEDLLIYETFFKGDDDSTSHHYIELGAFDGVRESNTIFYEKCLGWEGLLIEGNPGKGIYDRLVGSRPNSHRMNYVPSCNQTEEDMNKTIAFHARAFTNSGLDAVKTAYDGLETVDVPCGTMTQVLLDVFPPDGRVSFFSLDVEGSEHLVLSKALDLEKVMIEMLMVEVENIFCKGRDDCAVRNNVREHMKKMGYVRFSGKILYSDVFIRQDSKLLQKAIDQGWEESINK